MSPSSRPPPSSASDKQSFAYESTAKRWPTILTQAIDGLYQAASALSSSSSAQDVRAKVDESKSIIEKLSKLKHDIGRDHPLHKLEQDSGPSVDLYNSIIEEEKPTWFTAAWLFAECYLYRLVRIYFDQSQHWKYYDPFANQKMSAFRSSGSAIEQLAKTLEDLIKQASSGQAAAGSEEGMKLTFFLLAQSALWGNATDLSLLTSLSHADIQSLQAGGIGADAQKGRERFILTGLGALDSAWKQLSAAKKQGRGGRVDIVLDNSGFELVTDMMLGHWLLEAGYASEVVFHGKAIPWFVSDVTPPDFAFTIEALQEQTFFDEKESKTVERSLSRPRGQANVDDFTGGERPRPAGSRSLKMEASTSRERSPAPAGSKGLQASAGAVGSDQGRGRQPAGSRSLTMDPAYFQNSRSRTVSPSRSFLVDSTSLSFADLAIAEEGKSDTASRPSATRSASGFRSQSASAASSSTQRLAATWSQYIREGKFKLSVPVVTKLGESTGLAEGDFWTEGVGYDQMGQVAPGLLSELREKSALVIFKGDLNYRKLTGDLQWPTTTPFETSIGALAGSFPLLSLRTCKADVVVGLAEGVEERVAKEDPKWRVNGSYAVVEFVGKK
ncbi:DUF89-domain-containing protein [Microstroma glucosiphilum]|uniref:DUF89-domain-containing protein n=1 Tax=Pseudomicrostroma glucosiphilum TaxID=1684307 RepID=A0A316UAS7_9BASI|nr:DUF89-domain-containing protein [Pseudomicrostroma glucosiphilum]PWN22259.1 DUF89-domain-containing protein [Pseudomicrostroma glucosiphilum]